MVRLLAFRRKAWERASQIGGIEPGVIRDLAGQIVLTERAPGDEADAKALPWSAGRRSSPDRGSTTRVFLERSVSGITEKWRDMTAGTYPLV